MTLIEQRSRTRIPLTLPAIAGVEAWERFSFYGMQALLAYYLYSTAAEGGLGMDQAQATALVGAYGSALYLCTYAGGWVADRLLGAEKTLLTGAALLMAGHLSLSLVPGYAGLIAGLVPLALGSGLLKTAAITILGAAFPPEAGKRDGAFQIFYLGINIGALLGPMLTGWLAERYGYHAGFAAAAGLMAIGCVFYLSLRRRALASLADAPFILAPTSPIAPRRAVLAIAAVAALVLGAIALLPPSRLALTLLILTAGTALVLFMQMLRSPQVDAPERRRVLAFIPLFACSTVYWALQSQIYGVLAVYSRERLDRTIGSFEIPAAWTQSLNPFYILVFTLPIAAIMARYRMPARRVLMGGGLALAGAGMFLLLPYSGGGTAPFIALAGCIATLSLGEMLIGPVGMAASAAHAPRAFATRFSALYFLTMAIGTALTGTISTFYSLDHETAYIVAVGAVPFILGLAVALAPRARG